MKNLIILSFLLLTSCVTNTDVAENKGYSVNCSGKANSWAKCHQTAKELCGVKSYRVYGKSNKDSVHAPFISNDSLASKSNKRFMFIICGQ